MTPAYKILPVKSVEIGERIVDEIENFVKIYKILGEIHSLAIKSFGWNKNGETQTETCPQVITSTRGKLATSTPPGELWRSLDEFDQMNSSLEGFEQLHHSVDIPEIYSQIFLTKFSWKQRFYYQSY